MMERVVFVCDNFADKFIGGAELSVQVHIDSCPFPKILVKSSEFNPKKFNHKKDLLVFGNYANLNRDHFGDITTRFKYVIEECDYKYCSYRSSHKHKAMAGKDCDCHLTAYGLDIFAFMRGAAWMFWKSERQRGEYIRLFGYGVQKNGDYLSPLEPFFGTIVGGVFSDEIIDFILSLKDTPKQEQAFVLYSGSWIKGYSNASRYCRENKIKELTVGNIGYRDCLRAMATCSTLVYLPNGFDVSCRMVTEAKLLGLKVITNNLVQHVTEPWFTGSDEDRIAFLRSRNPEFWRVVEDIFKSA